jgi:hypothetical protein
MRPSGGRRRSTPRQASISLSWMELNWSASGFTSFSQYHCTTAAS